MEDARFIGQDATVQATTALLTRYETEIVSAFNDNAVMRRFFSGSEVMNINVPGQRTISWNQEQRGKRPSTTEDGREENDGNIGYNPRTATFVTSNQLYNLRRETIDRSMLSGIGLELDTARSIGAMLAQEMDYILWTGIDSPVQMNGIIESTNIQDAGAPSGVWDVDGKAYDDILTVLSKLRNKSYDGPIDILMSPGILVLFDKFVSDGTTSQPMTYRAWLEALLNGGSIFSSSHPFTAAGGPTTTDKNTGAGGTAVNIFVAKARNLAGKVVLAYDMRSTDYPAPASDIKRNVQIKYTWKPQQDELIAYMDAIDMVT